jgi:asparagine synthase (glutamine-hydrolysing)
MFGFAGCIRLRGTDDPVPTLARLLGSDPPLEGAGDGRDFGWAAAAVGSPEDGRRASLDWSEDRSISLLFCGDEFSAPAPSPRRLIRAYERLGPAFVSDLNGCFSGLLFDRKARRALLFNDRYGLGRVYWREEGAFLMFASSASALLRAFPASGRCDVRGLAEYVLLGCVLQNRTLFPGVSLLPPGSAWEFSREGPAGRRSYFDASRWEQEPALSSAEYESGLIETFRRISPRYGQGGDIALSLTGGFDSRIALAWTHAERGSLPCYTFGGPYRDCADVRIARRLARIAGQPHETLRLTEAFLDDFPALAEQTVRASDGTMDVSGAVELHVNRQARAIARVRLTGNYGSEILRQHVAFRPRRLDPTLFTPEFAQELERAGETYRLERACHPLTFIVSKQMPWHHYARRTIECSQLSPRSPFLDNELVALCYRAPDSAAARQQAMFRLIEAGNARLLSVPTDRAIRARPIPGFTPLAHAWQEFTAKAEYAYDYGMPQWAARVDALLVPRRLGRRLLGHHKFYHFRTWYRDRLGDFLRESARSCPDLPGYREGAIRTLVDDHLAGRRNRTTELHTLLTLQLIHRHLLPAPA